MHSLHLIPTYSLLALITGILCLSQGTFVYLKTPKALTNRLYFFFCLATSIWLFSVTLLSSKLFSEQVSIVLAKSLYSGVVFMPTLALHFATAFLKDELIPGARKTLKIAYFFTFIFLTLVWISPQFITGIYDYPWGYYPKGGILHVIHTLFVLSTASYAIYLLRYGMENIKRTYGKNKRYYETKYLFLSFLFASMASCDFLHNWGIDFFPLGHIFVTIFISATTYAIFKHTLLGISVVVKRSLVYSLLLSSVTVIYFVAVYIASMTLGFTRFHSLPASLIGLTIITLLFKPMEQKIRALIDRLFLKRAPEVLEKENALLMQQIQKQDKMSAIAILAAGMAHEIKNPLGTLKTFAEYLPQKYNDAHFRQNFKSVVVQEVDRINGIVQQLLDFSKPKPLTLKSEFLTRILDETLDFLNSGIVKNNVNLIRRYDTHPIVRVDKDQLRQAFLNILLNSLQAMPQGGTLTTSTAPLADGFVTVSIRDTGQGMPKEALQHIFDPFYTTKENGTGLGLSVVHGIIQKHGWDISVESETGKGTAIYVTLKSQN